MINIGFITGARSEYGVMKRVIKELVSDPMFNVSIVATGMHYLQKYGNTILEIRKDALAPIIDAPCYVEEDREKEQDFVILIETLYRILSQHRFDVIYIIGDRLEAYATALAAHFLRISVAHYGGGQITNGAVDNIYRYNISNLSSVHFVTNIYAAERLKLSPIISNHNIYHVGSSAIDSIKAYLQSPGNASIIDKRLHRENYVLMTFHPETMIKRQKNTISEVMDGAISTIIHTKTYILITYPNNDDGNEAIIDVIKKWENHPLIVVRKNLGSEYYYVAVDNSLFVVGNSSSGVIEVPYFQKYTINVGERQSGRNAPKSVINIPDDCELLNKELKQKLYEPKCKYPQENIYGNGNSIKLICNILKQKFYNETD